jgi:hypothetical protein
VHEIILMVKVKVKNVHEIIQMVKDPILVCRYPVNHN